MDERKHSLQAKILIFKSYVQWYVETISKYECMLAKNEVDGFLREVVVRNIESNKKSMRFVEERISYYEAEIARIVENTD